MSKFGQELLKVVYTADSLEFHATDERQVRDEDLNWALYHPMLDLFIIANPETETVAKEPDYDDDFMEEMKGVFTPDAMRYVEFFQGLEKVRLEQEPTREASRFPVKLLFMDSEGMATGPEGHAGLAFLKDELGGREIVTVADIEAIAAKWKER